MNIINIGLSEGVKAYYKKFPEIKNKYKRKGVENVISGLEAVAKVMTPWAVIDYIETQATDDNLWDLQKKTLMDHYKDKSDWGGSKVGEIRGRHNFTTDDVAEISAVFFAIHEKKKNEKMGFNDRLPDWAMVGKKPVDAQELYNKWVDDEKIDVKLLTDEIFEDEKEIGKEGAEVEPYTPVPNNIIEAIRNYPARAKKGEASITKRDYDLILFVVRFTFGFEDSSSPTGRRLKHTLSNNFIAKGLGWMKDNKPHKAHAYRQVKKLVEQNIIHKEMDEGNPGRGKIQVLLVNHPDDWMKPKGSQ